jgi:predicted enzyme related to lactoylglutathione lyase
MHENTPPAGTVVWHDLTVPDAAAIRDFYARVVGWRPVTVSMGDYNDFSMLPPEGHEAAAGICYARGSMYVIVEDVDESAEACVKLGGSIVSPPRGVGGGRFCVIRDPAGAVCALYRPSSAA